MVAVCTARRIARSIASSVCKKPMASSIASSAPTDIDQLLLDGTNAPHYTTAEWPGFEHLLKDQKTDVGTLRVPRGQRCYAPDGVDDYIAVASLTGSETVVSSSGTSTPSIAAGRINFTAGTAWDITLSNGSRYLCNEESGSTAYDIGDSAAHGTITNATLASFHSTSASVLTNRNNDVGYRLSGSVYIPKKLNSTLAADGNALTHTGKCPQPGYAPQKVATFDGTDDYATSGPTNVVPNSSDFTICCWVKPNTDWLNGVDRGVFDTNPSTIGAVRLYAGSGEFRVETGGSGASIYAKTSVWTNQWHHLSLTYTSSTKVLELFIDGILVHTSAVMGSAAANAKLEIGRFNAGNNFSGVISDFRVYSAKKTAAQVLSIFQGYADSTNLTAWYPSCEGPGSGNTNTTIYDVVGGKNLTITNATISTFWSNSTDYTVAIPNYPLKYGYTVNGAGVIVPARLDGSADAAGNAIGQAAGGWASGLQNLNCLPYTNPLGVSVGLETSLDPTADRKTTSSSKRRRRNTSGRYDRFGARSTAMSDASSNAYFGD